MKQNRRQFIQTSASAAAVIVAAPLISAVKPKRKPTNLSVNMKLSWTPYDLQLRHV
ncbi:MAG TPA: dipeptide epimerase, partial [Porphyromonadaceae bacterium]|nr:dipeptide epimerase [Porphyromonadaceae bacterium]